jgi:transposase InsO family protein
MDQRIQFVLERRSGDVSMAALCRVFGISRETGYKWLRRYAEVGELAKLTERSRRPKSHPSATPVPIQRLVVQARRQHPHWGPRKLRAWLIRRGVDVPAASTIGGILKRAGLVAPRRRRRRATPSTQPFSACTAPNQVWCIDFKGEFRTGDGEWCIPLTITDAFSRFIICCVAVAATDAPTVRRILIRIFRDFGLPDAFRSDNGPPFASTGPAGLSKLSAGWLKLAIRHERIEPGKPQQNGRHERMHLTLKRETASPPAPTLVAQQRRFDRFRHEFNFERPHEALDNATPASIYAPSARALPPLIASFQYPFCESRLVDDTGAIRWGRRRVFIGNALVNEVVGVQRVGEHYLEILFGPITLGILDEQQLQRGLIRSRVAQQKVSAMYPV